MILVDIQPSVCPGPGLKPLFDQQPLRFGHTSGVVHRHELAYHRLLVNVLRVGLDVLRRIESDILHLHFGTVTQVAAPGQHGLHFFIAKLAFSPRCACINSY